MTEKKKVSKATAFFDVVTNRDIRVLRKRFFIIHIFFDLVMMFMIASLVVLNAFNAIRPVPVIVTNSKTGHVTFVEDTTAPVETTRITITEFMRTYIQKRSAQDPDIASNQAYVYSNMQTPRFTAILDAERADAGKHQKYFEKNIKADFHIENIKISGDRKIGGKLTIIGTGSMYFRPAVGFDGDYENFQKIPCFFQASVEVHEQRIKIPWGLLMDYYKIDYFEDDELLKAFLLKTKIEFSKNDNEFSEDAEETVKNEEGEEVDNGKQ
ncbi:MAG: hypothetical protein RBT69_10685 [Spirochaetia bacterium]|jgi:hypothetical protein|nr:hypothetical protein [Spirochaetia bacterium]